MSGGAGGESGGGESSSDRRKKRSNDGAEDTGRDGKDHKNDAETVWENLIRNQKLIQRHACALFP